MNNKNIKALYFIIKDKVGILKIRKFSKQMIKEFYHLQFKINKLHILAKF